VHKEHRYKKSVNDKKELFSLCVIKSRKSFAEMVENTFASLLKIVVLGVILQSKGFICIMVMRLQSVVSTAFGNFMELLRVEIYKN
jgi:hypothetical protein